MIHQPRYPLFSLFDDVLLLGPGGRTVPWPIPAQLRAMQLAVCQTMIQFDLSIWQLVLFRWWRIDIDMG